VALKNVLIISEHKTDHLVLSASLTRAFPKRFNVITATSMERPLDALMDRNNDAVIMAHAPETDYMLRLAQKSNVTVPIIVILDEASEATISRLSDLGARDYLIRGKIQDDLLHRILDYSIQLGIANKEIQSLSNRDALTGALNRTGFRAHVVRAIERSERYQFKTALLCLNIDHFSNINDQHGEGAGDQAIQLVSKRLANKKRNTDSVARIGGDEFAVVLEDVCDDTNVQMIAEKLMSAISEPIRLNEHQVVLEVSIGGAICPDNGTKFEDLVEAANSAMMQAKATPGNKYFCYNEKLSFGNSVDALNLPGDLRQAVRHDHFELHYQPRIDLSNEQVVGLEALLRWKHPQRGYIDPDEFLPLCETMGLMKNIGYRAIEKTCSALNWLKDHDLGDIDVAVNVSFSQFQDERFTSIVQGIVKKSGIDPSRLEFELTESTVLKSPEETKQRMNELKQQSHSFSLDDFGTGYSQLSHMTELPISALKIDRSFVDGVASNEHQQAVCMMIIDMAQRLGLLVIAEGVEDREQIEFLARAHCHQVQGFYYSPAIPLEQVPRFIEEQRFKESTLVHS
jgi:diguanylate cyclase (GGDEF)-like protein